MSIDVKEGLLENAAEAQRANGQIPTTADNERYLVGVLEQFDRKRAEAKPQRKVKSEKKPGARQKEYERRARRAGYEPTKNWDLVQGPKPLALGGGVLQASKVETAARKRLRHRLRQMRNHPDFEARMKRINPLAMQGQFGREKQEAAAEEWRKLLAESDRKWGEWWKPAARTLFSHTGQPIRG